MIAPDLMGDDFRAWFEARLATLHPWAAKIVAAGRNVSPAIIVFRDDLMVLMPVDLDSVMTKNRVAALHRMVASVEPSGAIFVSEVWMAPSTKDEAERLRNERDGLAHHPERTEAVVWSALRGERQLMAMAAIKRGPSRLEPFEVIDPQRSLMSGRMIHEPHKGH